MSAHQWLVSWSLCQFSWYVISVRLEWMSRGDWTRPRFSTQTSVSSVTSKIDQCCLNHELQGSGNFLLLNLAVKTLIGFLAIIWLYSTSLPFKIIFWLSTIKMTIISSIIVLAFSFQKFLLTFWFPMSNLVIGQWEALRWPAWWVTVWPWKPV